MEDSSERYEFGEFVFDRNDRVLFRGSEIVGLPPKTCELLTVLIEHAGRIVGKSELMEQVWPGTFVEEANLSHHIAVLRKSLSEEKTAKEFIETIPRKGYRFVAPIRKIESSPAEITVTEQTRTEFVEEIEVSDDLAEVQGAKLLPRSGNGDRGVRSKFFVPALAVVLLIGIATGSYFWFNRTTTVRSVAVLPFRSLAAEPNDDFLKLGMADSLITKLSSIKKVAFRPTSSILKFRDAEATPVQAGKELGVDAVLEGWLQQQNDRVKVTAQLIKTSDGTIIWAESFDESLTNIHRLQDSISERITTALALELTGEERRSIAKNGTQNPEAYRLYLQGRLQWYQWTSVGWQKAAEYFQQAIELDPNFAAAYAGLGDSYGAMGFSRPSAETYFKSKEATLKALELDPNLPDAHATLGLIKFFYERDVKGGRESLLHALQLNPNGALIHDEYSNFLNGAGNPEEAILESKRAVELDPLTPYILGDLGQSYYFARQPEKAIEALNRSLELNPNYTDALSYLARISEQKGQFAEAENYSERILIATNRREEADEQRTIFANGGYRAVLEKRLERLQEKAKKGYVSSMSFAAIYASLGDKKQALEWLAKAEEEKAIRLMFLASDPQWDGLRSIDEFQALLHRLNLK